MPEPTANWTRLFASGRLCLFGEHSDWAAEFGRHPGFCLVIGTDQGLRGQARPSDEFVVETVLMDATGRPSGRRRQMSCPWAEDTLLEAAQDQNEFFRYCAGVAHEVFARQAAHGGLELQIHSMDLPLKKGVSSSAAVCILVAKAFDAVYDLKLFPHELMDLAFRGEQLTGSQCGRMDQACIYGKTPVLLTFQARSEARIEPLQPGGEIAMFFVDLAGRKDTVRILADLQSAYLASESLQAALGAENERIVREAYKALSDGDAEALGRLMVEAQQVFDRDVAPHSPRELAGPLLHEVLSLESIQEHIHGGKGVGSQGDGTAQFVARSPEDRDKAIEKIQQAYAEMMCFPLSIGESGFKPGKAS